MSDQPVRRPSRRTTVVLVGVLIAVIVVVTVVGLITAAALPPSAPATTGAPATTYTPAPSPTLTPSSSPTSSATAKPKPTGSATPKTTTAPTPQPTKAAPITESTPAAIKKELSVRVTKMEAVTGTADGPGEVAGPSVRFTIRIDNSTGKAVDLSNTVVNAYFGVNSTPAIALQSPGGKAFPASVADGSSASGVFVFNIPKTSRGTVQVTVDTSVNNPVIAFKGAAPTS